MNVYARAYALGVIPIRRLYVSGANDDIIDFIQRVTRMDADTVALDNDVGYKSTHIKIVEKFSDSRQLYIAFDVTLDNTDNYREIIYAAAIKQGYVLYQPTDVKMTKDATFRTKPAKSRR